MGVNRGIAGASGLAALHLLWAYVANAAAMSEPVRTLAKDLTFCTGILSFLALAGYVSVKAHEQWVRITAVALLIALVGSSVIVTLVTMMSGQGFFRNSALLGESDVVQVLAGAGGIILYALVLTSVGILWGGILRRLRARYAA
jgi:hypothetical protein